MPGYYDKNNVFIEYEKRWYCSENKTIHNSKKEFTNCKKCNP